MLQDPWLQIHKVRHCLGFRFEMASAVLAVASSPLSLREQQCFEILSGLGLLVSETRRTAPRGLIALLIAVPADVYMRLTRREPRWLSLN